MRPWILLVGGYRLPDRTASGVRALGMATLFRSIGFNVIVLGKLPDDVLSSAFEIVYEGTQCRDIRRPLPTDTDCLYETSASSVSAMIDYIGRVNIKTIIAYNYPAWGAFDLIRTCRANGIPPVLDITEWYGWEGNKFLRNIWRQIGVFSRIRLLSRLAGNIICASTWFQAKLPNQNTHLLPFALDTRNERWTRSPETRTEGPLRLLYSGSPGVGLHKDRLPPMIDALAELASEGQSFECAIAGIEEAEYLSIVPEHRASLVNLSGHIRFLGRIPHSECLSLLRMSDFSVFFRKSNRMSNTGFATKFVESLTLGVPVITNPTSDIARYLRNGENGILANSDKPADVKDALRRAVTMSPEELADMRATARSENPFDMQYWADETKAFLDRLRVPE